MRVLITHETSGVMRRAFQAEGHKAISNDLRAAQDITHNHLKGDALFISRNYGPWDVIVSHPDCTYLTVSAAWAFKDPNYIKYPGVGYHQKVKPGTLTGAARRVARDCAISHVKELISLQPKYCKVLVIENPIGSLTKSIGKPSLILQPHQHGEDASKSTCLWVYGLDDFELLPTDNIPPRMVDGRPRWANQGDGGQNRLGPNPNRWAVRSNTYPGVAKALAREITKRMQSHG